MGTSPPSTPPHHPTYQVQLSSEQIAHIVSTAIPNAELVRHRALPYGSSFNNRLYELCVRVGNSSSPSAPTASVKGENADGEDKALMLKICGRFWKTYKTLNEVMCLKLIRILCPEIPVPEVLGYFFNPDLDTGSADYNDKVNGGEQEWILMTKLPGIPLAEERLNDQERRQVMSELASHLAALRSKISSPGLIGNLEHVELNGAVTLGRSVEMPHLPGWPLASYGDYVRALLGDSIGSLDTNPLFERNRRLVPVLKDFVQSTLARLPVMTCDARTLSSLFTHNDLSDRNLLVLRRSRDEEHDEESRVHLSGILDWEFSGFFPPFDEYLSASEEIFGESSEDYSEAVLQNYVYARDLLSELEKRGIDTPRVGFIQEHWEEAKLLHQLRENIAPWWLRGRGTGDDLNKELDDAAEMVDMVLKKLAARVV